MNRLEYWKEVWEKKGKQTQNFDLHELIAANGFDMGLGKMSTKTYLDYAKTAKKELDIRDGDILLDVGCGTGVMLLLLSTMDIEITGIDYSEAHIKIARKVVPSMTAKVSEARCIPFKEGIFSKILSSSTFHYFPDFSYATEVLLEMKRVVKEEGEILIMDVPDLSKKRDNRTHLYYPKSFFESFAEEQGMGIKVFNQNLPRYGNSPFRFNVLLWRLE